MNTQNNECQHYGNYRNLDNNQNVEYFCPRRSQIDSQYCKFHDPDFLDNATEKDIKKLRVDLEAEIESLLSNSKSIECVGYHLPEIDFSSMIFSQPVYFTGTVFHGNCNFSNVQFQQSVDFSQCHVYGDAIFTGSRFDNQVNFFSFIQEEGITNFQNIVFNHKTNFSNGIFQNGLFTTCSFFDVTFKSAIFNGLTEFWDSVFHGKSDFTSSKFNGFTNFRDVVFETQETVSFDGKLDNVSFIGTDITRIKFGENTTWGTKDRFDIYDAREIREKPSAYNLGNVLAVYRNLRENYEFRLKYEEAGKCFVREMQLRRFYEDDPANEYRAKKRNKLWQFASATSFYSYLCEYGENLRRPAIYSSIVFAFAFAYYLHYPESEKILHYSLSNPIDYGLYFGSEFQDRSLITIERSLSAFFHVGKNDIPDLLVRITSIPILGTLFIVLRRRFERRFRH